MRGADPMRGLDPMRGGDPGITYIESNGSGEDKHYVGFSHDNSVFSTGKHSDINKINVEGEVTGYVKAYVDDVNHILAHADQIVRIQLQLDESASATNNVVLSQQSKRLRKCADSPARDFIDAGIEKLKVANRNFLRSFKLRLVVEEVTA